MFRNKKNIITVDAFVENEGIMRYPISKVANNLPQWVRSLKSTHEVNATNTMRVVRSTFKGCDSFRYMMNNFYSLPMWSDLEIETDNEGNFEYVYPHPSFNYGITSHSLSETDGSFSPLINVKINSPYLLKCNEDIKFYMTQATYSHNGYGASFYVLPGVVDFKYQHGTHINMFMSRNKRYKFDAGQSMMYLTPLTEREVVFKTHLVSNNEFNNLVQSNAAHKFIGSYRDKVRREKNGDN